MTVRRRLRQALVLLAVFALGCALVHERTPGTEPARDAEPAHDGGHTAVDAGPITHCSAFWSSLPACPAVTARAIGRPCSGEGETCGVHCCEPGPPIACSGGRWVPLEHQDDCSGVRCRGPRPCGDGQCAFSRVCLIVTGEVIGEPVCVQTPEPVEFECAVPAGSLDADPASCTTCTCMPGVDGQSVVVLDCACC